MSLSDFYEIFFYGIWVLWSILWLVLARNVKVTARQQAALPRLFNIALLVAAAAVLAAPHLPVPGLEARLLPGSQWQLWAAVGAALTFLGLLFTVWARIYLGRNWSGVAAVKADHELITGGPYRWVRHPIYSGLALAFVGMAVAGGVVHRAGGQRHLAADHRRGALHAPTVRRCLRCVCAAGAGLHTGSHLGPGVKPSLDGSARLAVLAALLPDGEALDDDHAAAFAAPAEAKLIAPRQALRQEDRVLE